MNAALKVKRFKELQEAIGVLRKSLKDLEEEKKKLEREILTDVLGEVDEIVVDNFLVIRKTRESYYPKLERVREKVDEGAFLRLVRPSVSDVRKYFRKREILEELGEFVKTYYVDVKLLKLGG